MPPPALGASSTGTEGMPDVGVILGVQIPQSIIRRALLATEDSALKLL